MADDRPFERVWKILLRVPRGKVVTYGLLSQMIERRLTPVAIGWAIRALTCDASLHSTVDPTGTVGGERRDVSLRRLRSKRRVRRGRQ